VKASLYSRPDKPRRIAIKKRTGAPEMALPELSEIVAVDSATQCHVTPLDVAGRMVGYLGPVGDFLTLEPEAGTGNIMHALYASGHSVNELVAIERHHSLCNVIRQRFKGPQYLNPIQSCFLEYAEEASGKIEYPRIIMNPPFRQIKKHMKAALSLLGRGGHDAATLVALVPVTYDHTEAETMETLGVDVFPNAKVTTKVIRILR